MPAHAPPTFGLGPSDWPILRQVPRARTVDIPGESDEAGNVVPRSRRWRGRRGPDHPRAGAKLSPSRGRDPHPGGFRAKRLPAAFALLSGIVHER
jgi:hypothetical protein